MGETDIRIHCEAGHGYIGFVASISLDNHGFHQRTTLRDLTPELARLATEVMADSVMAEIRRADS